MEYAKLQLRDTRGPEWRLASMHARGAAVSVLAYCADRENGGRIDGAADWTADHWRDVVGVKPADVERAVDAHLCSWHEGALVCHLYDMRGERALEVKRAQAEHGRKGAEHGHKGGRPRKPHQGVSENGHRGFTETPIHNPPRPDHPDQTTPPTPPTSAEAARVDLFSPPAQPPEDASDEDRWPYVQREPWTKALKAIVGNKIGKTNWRAWLRLTDAQHWTLEQVVDCCEALPPDARWPDSVEVELQANCAKRLPTAAAATPVVAPSPSPLDDVPAPIASLLKSHPWKRLADLVPEYRIPDAGAFADFVNGNPAMVAEVVKRAGEKLAKAPAGAA
jgi:hypothetical protein